MMVGHALLAFALVVLAARVSGAENRYALVAGLVAGAFATVPDVDMVYALVGVARAEATGVLDVTNAFWSASTVVHRTMTHSLVVAPLAAVAAACWVYQGEFDRPVRGVGGLLLVALVCVAAAELALLGAVVMGAFALATALVAVAVRELTEFGPRTVGLLAFVGLVSHPWGDLFTGEPPALLWPLDTALLSERVVLSTDPTLHLLGAFALELATVWLALLVLLTTVDVRFRMGPRGLVGTRALVGVGYAGVAFLLPPPTLDVSYHFVFTILGVGTVLAAPDVLRARLLASARRLRREWDTPRLLTAFVTGLAAVTLALFAYTALYVLRTLSMTGAIGP
ncbi:metal-dependent hydrolase [Haloarchaeobius sp. TZWWS8]|uniref:metal-dependent hydrolase n=1 Tax=Haloarchaeobius sp. TZWWS8 TaxID=3446121 RepID=UPI003EBBF575